LRQNSGPKYFSSSFDKAELAVTLQGTGPFTVFAPTNAAFTTFLSTAGYASINDKAALTQILLNHVVSGSVKS
jgi:uncharacterized surface protein with fasciclin (FAS1) repeats